MQRLNLFNISIFCDSHFVIEPYNMFQGLLNFMHCSENSSTFNKLEILILNSNRKQLSIYFLLL